MTAEEVIIAIKKATEELGRVPSLEEVLRATQISRHAIRRNFISYREALAACGLERRGTYRLPLKLLFMDWAEVVRKLGRIPTVSEYEMHAKHSHGPLIRIYRGWRHVAAGLLEYAREEGLEAAWQDVVDIVARQLGAPTRPSCNTGSTTGRPVWRRKMADQLVYGAPMARAPMVFEPTNEAGVAVLFGAIHGELGFSILHVQQGFPDCEAMLEIEPGKCQRERIEFEFQSRNFLAHMHPPNGCDRIVCWEDNWPDSPIEVLELKSAMEQLMKEGRFQICQECQRRRRKSG